MSSDYIEPYIDGFYTQRAFRRVYECMKRTSDEKVMIVRSWHSRAHSLMSSARRAPPRRSAQPHTAHAEELSTSGQLMQLMQKSSAQEVSSCSSCGRAQHKRSAHAGELSTAHAEELSHSSCRRAQHCSCRRAQPQLMQKSSATAHAGELSTAHAKELSHSSCRRAQLSSCRRAQPQLILSDPSE